MSAPDLTFPAAWYESHTNLARLYEWMREEGIEPRDDVTGFLEKPWRYSPEWAQFQAAERDRTRVAS